jgi:hypothetical protein
MPFKNPSLNWFPPPPLLLGLVFVDSVRAKFWAIEIEEWCFFFLFKSIFKKPISLKSPFHIYVKEK